MDGGVADTVPARPDKVADFTSASVRTPYEGRISAISACLCMDERGRSSLWRRRACRDGALTAPEIGSEFP